ncbi:hypothetical protein ACSYDW_12575 [Paeniglutamicibacter sp. R2-26]|uniref:hypothetical protein n=1 Tax=Paeniglutamicibacter sp. R2-26 TaxID=3144417 RepID=UPI003EE6EF30
MDLMQQRYKKRPGQPSIDGPAVAKGWFVTLGLWLGSSLAFAIYSSATLSDDPGTLSSGVLGLWSIFALYSVGVAMLIGLPLALLLDRSLRFTHSPWIHIAAFLAVFTALPMAVLGFSMDGEWIQPCSFSLLLGICAALGRAAAFRQGGSFRRPTTWTS